MALSRLNMQNSFECMNLPINNHSMHQFEMDDISNEENDVDNKKFGIDFD